MQCLKFQAINISLKKGPGGISQHQNKYTINEFYENKWEKETEDTAHAGRMKLLVGYRNMHIAESRYIKYK